MINFFSLWLVLPEINSVDMFDGKIVGEKENKNVTDRELGLLMAGVA